MSFGSGGGGDSSKAAARTQKDIYYQARKDLTYARELGQSAAEPYLNAVLGYGQGGNEFVDALKNLSSNLDIESIQSDPIYQWRLQQQQQELDKYLAGKGKLYSSLAPEKYASMVNALTGEEADKLYSRELNKLATLYGWNQNEQNTGYGRLLDAMNIGLAGAGATGQAGASYANNITGLAGIQAQQAAAQQSNLSSGLGLIGAAAGSAWGLPGVAVGSGIGSILGGFLG